MGSRQDGKVFIGGLSWETTGERCAALRVGCCWRARASTRAAASNVGGAQQLRNGWLPLVPKHLPLTAPRSRPPSSVPARAPVQTRSCVPTLRTTAPCRRRS